jgi:16S rRNA (adenine1518-N6/adenine1519-N6)-dimethyltransferase
MSQTKTQIQQYLAQVDTEPRHRFGQNFMIDQNIVRLIADSADLTERDVVIEVGPGTGTLTEELLARTGRVVAVEIDRDLARLLRSRLATNPRFHLIEGDALDGKHAINAQLKAAVWGTGNGLGPIPTGHQPPTPDPEPQAVKLVANLPYNIASPLIIELLLAGVSTLVFTVQKEVADRLASPPDTDDFGPLSVVVQQMADVRVIRTLGPGVFWPPPKIDSALVRIDRKASLVSDDRGFAKFVQSIFMFRRKTLRRAIQQAGFDLSILGEDIDGGDRPEVLDVSRWVELFKRSPRLA